MMPALAALGALVALLAALLAVPLVLAVEAERRDTLRLSWRVRGLFGLLDVGSDRASRRAPGAASGPHAPRTRIRSVRRRARIAFAVLRTRGLIGRITRTASSLLMRIRVHEFRLHTRFGFDNPADTGIACGYLSPLVVLAGVRGLDVRCDPMFDDAGWQGLFRASVRVRPLAVFGVLLTFVLSPPVLRAMTAAWRARR